MQDRLTRRDAFGRAYIPGYAPNCADAQTCRLLVLLTDKLAEIEDTMEEKDEDHADH